MTTVRWISGSVIVLGLGLLIGGWRRLRRMRDHDTVTPQWINEHAYDRHPPAHGDESA